MSRVRNYPFACALVLLAILVAFPWAAAAQTPDGTVTVKELTENMQEYDGKTVTITGEVIGDVLKHGDYSWVTVNDDSYAQKSLEDGGPFAGYVNYGIGVWVLTSETEDLKILGNYKAAGDHVTVTGVFNRADVEHGGDTDIHATSFEKISDGYYFPHGFQYWKLLAIIVLAIAVAVLLELKRRRMKRSILE